MTNCLMKASICDSSQQVIANDSDEINNFNIPADYFSNGTTLDDYPDEHIPDPADVDVEAGQYGYVCSNTR